MSYNNIGLLTPRGSATSGYVQRNLSSLNPKAANFISNRNRKVSLDLKPPPVKKPSKKILEHKRKRKIELLVVKLRMELEEKNTPRAEIDRQEKALREKYKNPAALAAEESHDTHAKLDAQRRRNLRLKKALGIAEDHQTGEAFNFGQPRATAERGTAGEKKDMKEVEERILKDEKANVFLRRSETSRQAALRKTRDRLRDERDPDRRRNGNKRRREREREERESRSKERRRTKSRERNTPEPNGRRRGKSREEKYSGSSSAERRRRSRLRNDDGRKRRETREPKEKRRTGKGRTISTRKPESHQKASPKRPQSPKSAPKRSKSPESKPHRQQSSVSSEDGMLSDSSYERHRDTEKQRNRDRAERNSGSLDRERKNQPKRRRDGDKENKVGGEERTDREREEGKTINRGERWSASALSGDEESDLRERKREKRRRRLH